jgi:hypothetical protein
MPVSSQMLGVAGDECQCGRRATVRHCPSCGSFRVYGRTNKVHKFPDGSYKLVETEFRCQACTHLFVDEEREFCEAPAVGKKLATQKVAALHEAAKSGDALTPAERIAAESILKAMRSGTPLENVKTPRLTMTDDERNRLITELKKAHLQHLLEYNAKQRSDHPGPIEEYVKKGIEQNEQDWIKASRA